jgi:nucleotidyltransferase/DNA polymerase involved in DNA repair
MQTNFGKAGEYYYWISRGIDNREVRASRIRKSVGAENTFASDLVEIDALAAELQPLIDKVWQHCKGHVFKPPRHLGCVPSPLTAGLKARNIPASIPV